MQPHCLTYGPQIYVVGYIKGFVRLKTQLVLGIIIKADMIRYKFSHSHHVSVIIEIESS